MSTTDRTDTPLERSALTAPTTTTYTELVAPRRGVAAFDPSLRLDAQLRPTLDTTEDPTGAAFLWPLVMLLTYVVLGVGFVVAR